MRHRRFFTVLAALALSAAMVLSVGAVSLEQVEVKAPVKNVILLIPDGMSTDVVTLARWYQGGGALNLDSMASGLVRTYSSDAPIADSAPAGTAMATGHKSHTGYVGVLPDVNSMPGLDPLEAGTARAPVASILEAARLEGKATGVIATSEIMHATPADFTAHYASRKDYDILSKQQVYQGVDVVLGAGSGYLAGQGRADGNDLIEVIQENYQYVTTPAGMEAVTSGKLWGMFAETALAYEFDRDPKSEPSLAQMTEKAIELLSQDEDGFFLMVEGSKIDWAAHANDPIGLISDCLAFDRAVGVALDFAKADGNTLVIAATDHGNSGVSIGSAATTGDYDKQPLSNFIDPLKKATLTGEGLEKVLNAERSNVVEVMSRYFGIDDLTDEEIEAIKNTENGSMNYTVGPMIARRADIGFTTGGHTGEDVTLYVYAPANISQLTGTVENTDIALYMAKAFGVDLDETTERLFVPARKAVEAIGGTISFDRSDKGNPILTISKGDVEVKMPVYTNIAYVNGEKTLLDGVTVFDGVGTNYVPQSAIDLLK
ncbi:alkaline phosphatase [Feifania hominis]|uniref:Alkaline phosphatase n=1 Tax=Feifania hominis TaxID=2763660 RepID=A0A926HVR1_9FIRM|nr:alkaline phosphatase [Feifania hominis]MBC8536886.1 alkaline phosphatase [Feifania hominis]